MEVNHPETCDGAAPSTTLCSKSLPFTQMWREAVVPLSERKVPHGEAAGELLGQTSEFLKTRTSLFKEREHKIQSKAQREGMGPL